MKIVIDIDEDVYEEIKKDVESKVNTFEHIPFLHEVIAVGTPISEWLSSFNTESAPKCFEAVQKLKMEVNADEDSD